MNHWTQEEIFTIHLEGHGREEVDSRLDISRTVGWMTSLFPVTLKLSEVNVLDLEQVIMEIKEQLRALPGKGLGYGLLKYIAEDEEIRSQLSMRRWPISASII